ncbi:MAG: nucleotidyltransferase domain-containing protein [Blastocatellia bacterium]
MRHEKLRQILSELRGRLVEHYGDRLVDVVLFGSQARGDASPGSDIDVMAVLKGAVYPGAEIERTGDFVAELSLKYDVLISVIFRSEEAFYYSETPLLINVRREGVQV